LEMQGQLHWAWSNHIGYSKCCSCPHRQVLAQIQQQSGAKQCQVKLNSRC
jgi:hypothetical protein